MKLVGGIDVDGREADLAPEAAAGGDAAVDEVGAAERRGDGAHRPFLIASRTSELETRMPRIFTSSTP